ncbi:MAG: RNA polymerase subunit sigma-24, partial [Planctomycetes bacterium]|nr:RNA polymerase subunit sigma-24 [Planctomycetota bacterium]
QQERARWDRTAIAEGAAMVERALAAGRFGSYCLQAAIAAVHAESASAAATDWAQIAGLYDVLLRLEPSPVVELNRAVAIAMRDGAQAGLTLLAPMLLDERLARFHLTHAAHADLLRRLDRRDEARAAYDLALQFVQQEPERRFLRRRRAELDD